MNDRYIFVYGTLRQGAQNSIDRLTPEPELLGRAWVAGVLYSFDRYPGMALFTDETTNTAPQVIGEVWKISAELENTLDQIEAQFPSLPDEFIRHHQIVHCQGQPINCLMYLVNPIYLEGREPIKNWRLARTQPISTQSINKRLFLAETHLVANFLIDLDFASHKGIHFLDTDVHQLESTAISQLLHFRLLIHSPIQVRHSLSLLWRR